MSVLSPTLASVIFIRIQDFSRRTVAEQARLRVQLEAVVAVAIGGLRAEERVLLDAADGMAIVVLANPVGALDTAERSSSAAAGLPLCIGINHGPVTGASTTPQDADLAGDGVHSAAIIAGFAEPSRVLVSRSFRDALAERAPERDATLRAAGLFTDASVRTHELLTPDNTVAERRRRRLLTIGVLGAAALLASGGMLREVLQARAAARQPATLVLQISPDGEVFVDGAPKGLSPPLVQLEISPGNHVVEVRNASHPPFRIDLNLAPGEQATVRHAFASQPPPVKAKKSDDKKQPPEFVKKLREILGFE